MVRILLNREEEKKERLKEEMAEIYTTVQKFKSLILYSVDFTEPWLHYEKKGISVVENFDLRRL